jgi:uncharacterized protein (TIGR02246 family)
MREFDRHQRRQVTHLCTSSTRATTDDAALRQVTERTTQAWADHDPAAFAQVFAKDTKVVIAGHYLQSRDEVRAYISAAFSGPVKGTRVIMNPVSAEFMSADTGVVMTEGGILLPGETSVAAERAIWGTWVLAVEDAEWRIRAYHSSPVARS